MGKKKSCFKKTAVSEDSEPNEKVGERLIGGITLRESVNNPSSDIRNPTYPNPVSVQ